MITIQDVYNAIHPNQGRLLVATSDLKPISDILNEASKDIQISVVDVHRDNSMYNTQYAWLVNDTMYRVRTTHGSYASLWINKVDVSNNTVVVRNHSVQYTTTDKYIFYAKYDENTGKRHCGTGPSIMRYDRDRNGNRRLSGVTYMLQGKTISEKAWNKKFRTNFNYKDQIEMEKVFKMFGKKFKIAHVDSTKENIHLVPYV